MKITELIKKMTSGEIAEGTKIKTSTGQNLIYKEGTLSWLTQGGYVSTGLILTNATMLVDYELMEPKEKQLSFSEAMQYIAEGDTVHMVIDKGDYLEREYEVYSLEKVDEILTNQEYFKDVYQAYYYVKVDVPKYAPPEYPKDVTVTVINPDAQPKAVRDGDYSKKLTRDDAWDILTCYYNHKEPVASLAGEYDVSERMIYYILDGTHWGEVKESFEIYHGKKVGKQ